MSYGLDSWNYIFFFLESLMNISFLPFVLCIAFICISQKNLHANCRTSLFVISVGYLICSLHRLTITTIRICCIANQNTPFSNNLILPQLLGIYLSVFGWLLVIIERIIASVFVGMYEQHYSSRFAQLAICAIIVLLASSALCVGTLVYPDTFDFFFLCMQVTIVSFCCTALIVMMLTNKSLYGKRHSTSMLLTDRYQIDENIRCGEYLIPVAINDVLCQLILVFLLVYSIYFTKIPVGKDTTHLSHAYDIITAYQRVFFGVALTVRNEKFDHIFNRRKRSAKVIEKQAAATSIYFNELRQMWS